MLWPKASWIASSLSLLAIRPMFGRHLGGYGASPFGAFPAEGASPWHDRPADGDLARDLGADRIGDRASDQSTDDDAKANDVYDADFQDDGDDADYQDDDDDGFDPAGGDPGGDSYDV